MTARGILNMRLLMTDTLRLREISTGDDCLTYRGCQWYPTSEERIFSLYISQQLYELKRSHFRHSITHSILAYTQKISGQSIDVLRFY
jgi:hypothetical protein